LVQLSAVEPQAVHAVPAAPQVLVDQLKQAAPVQQPPGHEAALQTHDPVEHTCPATQALVPPPQTQAPEAEQVSEVPLHARHAAPPTPQ
jgi:hypothetical protein